MFMLTSKIAAISGGGSGIGAATVETFTRACAFVYALDIDVAAVREVAERLNAGERCRRRRRHRMRCVEEQHPRRRDGPDPLAHGRWDVLMNNAGIGHVGTIMNTTSQDLDRLLAVNVHGVFNLTKLRRPHARQKRGSVINVASIGGILGLPEAVAYCTTKFAGVVGMTKCMRLHHAQRRALQRHLPRTR